MCRQYLLPVASFDFRVMLSGFDRNGQQIVQAGYLQRIVEVTIDGGEVNGTGNIPENMWQ